MPKVIRKANLIALQCKGCANRTFFDSDLLQMLKEKYVIISSHRLLSPNIRRFMFFRLCVFRVFVRARDLNENRAPSRSTAQLRAVDELLRSSQPPLGPPCALWVTTPAKTNDNFILVSSFNSMAFRSTRTWKPMSLSRSRTGSCTSSSASSGATS